MAEYITKKKKVNGEVVETTYRVDAAFKPATINEISMEFIENYCVANNEIPWLLATINTTSYQVERKDKETGKTYTETVTCENYPFVNIRKDFVYKFFPSIIKGNASTKETWKERLNRLYAAK